MSRRVAVCGLAVTVLGALGCGAVGPDDGSGEDFDDASYGFADAPPPKANGVSFGRDLQERAYGVEIKDKPHKGLKSIYSVRLADLSHTEQLRVRAEVVLSRCNPKDIAGLSGDSKNTPCNSAKMKQSPYGYTPRFSAAYFLGNGPGDTSGPRVSGWTDTRCPENQHHCALAVPEEAVKNLPDAAEKYLNLVVSADSDGKNARSWDVMEVEQGKGALAVTRIAPGASLSAIQKSSTDLISKQKMGIDQTEDEGDKTQVKHLLYQVKLQGLQPGDVIDVDARARAVLGSGFSCDPLITGEVLVTQDAGAKDTKKKGDEKVTERNGRNCSDHSNDGCKYEKSGAVRLGKDAPSTMFVSYLVQAARSCAAPNGGDEWHADPKEGSLKVNVRR